MAQSAQPRQDGADAAENSRRVSIVVQRLAALVISGRSIDPQQFIDHAVDLSKGIDYAVSFNEKPSATPNLPALVKQICETKFGPELQAFVMILLMSAKNACKMGWFEAKDCEEISTLANEMGKTYGIPIEPNPVASSHSAVETVMERFYPQLKIEHVLCSFEVKPGYGVYTNEFLITKETKKEHSQIRLLVAQVDNLDTCACIVTPQEVSFLINGRGIESRTYLDVTMGPLMPTIVTAHSKFGSNLLQALGQFNGNYVVLIAFMSETPVNSKPVLQDHVQPLADASFSDELTEGPSRISLNCPISKSRINLPVKGHSCKHLQCFDFGNFIQLNSTKPTWRCPCCNQSVCYLDIRVDQNMAKILKEVGEKVTNVIITADGSWKAVFENDDRSDQAQESNFDSMKETSNNRDQKEHSGTIDLTKDDNAMEVDSVCGIKDIKPSIIDLSATPQSDNTAIAIQTAPLDVLSSQGLYAGMGFPSESLMGNNPGPPETQSYSSLNSYQLPQMPSLNAGPSNEYGTDPSSFRMVERVPIAVQALPAQSHSRVIPRFRPASNSSSPISPDIASSQAGSSPLVSGYNAIYGDLERLISQPQAPVAASLAMSQPPLFTPQVHNRPYTIPQPRDTYRPGSLGEFQNSHLQHVFNPSLSLPMAHSLAPNSIRPTLPFPQAPPATGYQPVRTATRRPPHMGGSGSLPSLPIQTQAPRQASPMPGAEQMDLTPEPNWRPAGRMRGSISGQAYSNLQDIIITPTQEAQSPRPPPEATPAPTLQVFLANRHALSSQPHNNVTW